MAARILVCRVGAAPVVETLPADDQFTKLQALVGGYVELVSLADGVDLWCNEDGLGLGLARNRVVEGHHIVGDFLLARCDAEGEIASLTDADVAKYTLALSQVAA